MQRIEIGKNRVLFDKASLVRKKVFVEEQKVPLEIETDDSDKTCTHIVVTEDDRVIGAGRIDQNGKIGRIAVLKEYRGMGIGKKIMDEIEAHAKKNNFDSVHLNAQKDVISFYEELGYEIRSEIFYEANIPHKKMSKKL